LQLNKFEISTARGSPGGVRAAIDIRRKARFDQPLEDSQQVMTSVDVVSTTDGEDSVPEHSFGDFASALAKHRAPNRETGSVPA
jgi:hypothetical protein